MLRRILTNFCLQTAPKMAIQPQIPIVARCMSYIRGGKWIQGKGKGPSPTQLRGSLVDESVEADKNTLALSESEAFQLFSDGDTAERLFNGIKFKDLPIVTIKCTFNHTRFWVTKADGHPLFYTSPKRIGFLNAKKRTNVAAQAAGNAVGQKLRLLNARTVRVRVAGFNQGRIASIKGLVQSGTTVVSISDITTVHWDWPQRARKRKRQN